MSRGPRPPRLAATLLARWLAARHRDDVLAELDREYLEHVLPSRGVLGARAWYWRQALGSLAWQLAGRMRRRDHPLRRALSMRALAGDLGFAFRSLRRSPSFSLLAIATIALGMSASTTVFSVLNGVVLRPLPYPDSGRLVRLWTGTPISKQVMERVMETSRSFAPLAGYVERRGVLTGAGEPQDLYGFAVTPEYFALLGAVPQHGRTFTPQDAEPGGADTVILGHGLWLRTFGGDAAIIGRRIDLGGRPTTVVGVMARAHQPLDDSVAYWLPMRIDRSDFSDYQGTAQVSLLGRLASGVRLDAAVDEVARIAGRVRDEAPNAYSEAWVAGSAPVPLRGFIVAQAGAALWTTVGAVAFLLLIACANVGNLLLARATSRRREIAVRIGLGAAPARILRQLMAESLLVGVAGGIGGLASTGLLLDALQAWWPSGLPLRSSVRIDAAVLAFTFAAATACGLLAGVVPAARAARMAPQSHLKEGGLSASVSRSSLRTSRVLVCGQVAAAVVLVVAAGLMLRSLRELMRVDPGFDADPVTAMRVRLPDRGYEEGWQRAGYVDQVGARLTALPGVTSFGAATFLPMATGTPSAVYRVAGVQYPEDQPPPTANFQLVGGDYFRVMGIPVRRGRVFDGTEEAGGPTLGVVNETLARRAFGAEDPIGKSMSMFGGVDFRVIGVVGDSRQRSPAAPPAPEAFFSYHQISWWSSLFFVVRVHGDTAAPSAAALRSAIWEVDPDIPVSDVWPMRRTIERASAQPRFFTRLLGAFGLLALLLGAIGVYGVMSYALGQQVRELGIRLALGATHGDILRQALWRGMTPVLLGVGTGVAGALALSGLLRGMLYEVAARDPATFTLVPLILVAVGALAAYLPARRAAALDPARSLQPR